MYTQTPSTRYHQVQHYQKAAAGVLRAKLLKQPMFEAFFRQEMSKAQEAIRATRTCETIQL